MNRDPIHLLAFVTVAALTACLPGPSAGELSIRLEPAAQGQAYVAVSGISAPALSALESSGWSRETWSELLAVRVEQKGSDSIDPSPAVAVLGSYQVVDGEVRFTPMFPFDPGRAYRVVFHPRHLPDSATSGDDRPAAPLEVTVSLPARDPTPRTRVELIYPTTDVLPENQLKLYIHFSAPMSRDDGLPHIKLLDPEGNEVIDPFLPLGREFWDYEGKRYTVFFDPGRVKRGILPNEQMGRPVVEGGVYTLLVDQAFRDAAGLPLQEEFRKTFTVSTPDETPVYPATWTLHTPAPGTREPLKVDFGEPLDHGLLQRALGVRDRQDQPVLGEISVSRSETRWLFSPEVAWQAGEYHLIAFSFLEDLAGNEIGKAFEVDVFDRIDDTRGADPEKTHRIPFTIQ